MTNEHRGVGRAHLDAAEAALGLEMLFADVASGPLRPDLPLAPAVRMAAALAGRPLTVARRGAGLAAELARIGLGRSTLAPSPHDERYADPAWSDNPLLRRVVQTHIAAGAIASDLITDARLDGPDDERIRSTVTALVDALAPSNTPLNPAVWRRALGGENAVRGVARLAGDLAARPRVPASQGACCGFDVGTDVAATPGAVVLRTPVAELIQYLPQTEEVRDLPLLVVPPLATRYYLADLAPRRSIVEHLVRGGQQVFLLSWRNPGPEHAVWDLDTYGRTVLDAIDACEHITRTSGTSLMAFSWSGGAVTAMLLAHLAAMGAQQRVASVTFAASVLDHEGHGTHDTDAARGAVAASARRGCLDGSGLVAALARRQPDDLRPNRAPHHGTGRSAAPAPEVLSWLADTVRLPAAVHRALVDVAQDNALVTPGAAAMLGTAVDLSKIDRDTYVVAGSGSDTWQSCYRTTGLLGGTSRFVLSTSGSRASVVCPPDDPDAEFQVAETTPPDASRWLATARPVAGSWWADHLAWLGERSGPLRDAPPELGGRGMHAVAPAPGEYVLQR
ncbi:PHA/PHB synthase family protein [Pseudonocardia sp. CA-142604]|uniref:PHA/PHB synthase family protein n=1 Tax=Pseudonocardia sp. CA-142604 TaxID=3240024 RepID=UPI003D923CA1